MTYGNPQNFVLSIYPFRRGFAFVLFEGPNNPFDWGVKEFRGKRKDSKTLAEIKKIVDRYRPDVLVIEDTDSRRTPRIRKLYRMLVHFAEAEYIDLHRCSRTEVKVCFASVGASTRYEVASAIATQIPAFAHRIPRRRRAWMSEDSRQTLFDAAALGFAYFARGIPSCYADDIASG
jgi:hypothetical protein